MRWTEPRFGCLTALGFEHFRHHSGDLRLAHACRLSAPMDHVDLELPVPQGANLHSCGLSLHKAGLILGNCSGWELAPQEVEESYAATCWAFEAARRVLTL